ncbi:MAG: cell division protein FtsL [Oceanobacter sp.]
MNVAVWLAVLVAALIQIGMVHWHRELLSQWQVLDTKQRELTQEQTRLLLEYSTLTAYGRIDQLARRQLNMTEPDNTRVLTQ